MKFAFYLHSFARWAVIRKLKIFKRAITGNACATTIESALVVCVVAIAALASAQFLLGAA